ncbi:MAG: hypothetical protein Athens041674_662 [Parcubacteria group bacterium Athens0416_74]|nr:MAG: hypothetical protein Athens041674_662 [Parcubacteria group bacterium Athens0416_74]
MSLVGPNGLEPRFARFKKPGLILAPVTEVRRTSDSFYTNASVTLRRAAGNRTRSSRTRIVRTTGILRPDEGHHWTHLKRTNYYGPTKNITSDMYNTPGGHEYFLIATRKSRSPDSRSRKLARRRSVLHSPTTCSACLSWLCTLQDSNLRPFECESNALTN